MTKHMKIPKGYRKVRADSILESRDKYWNYGRQKWVQTQYVGYKAYNIGGFYIRHIRPIRPKPKVKPRKEARGKRGGRGRK